MIIDEQLIANGITVDLLAELIEKHAREISRLDMLNDYYIGKHAILNRTRSGEGLANNRIVFNHAKYAVDMMQSFLVGNAVSYQASEEYDIEVIKNAYLEQDMASVDGELAKNMVLFGRAYELIYTYSPKADSSEKTPRSVSIDPRQGFVVYNDDCTHFPLFGVYYYMTYDVRGQIAGVVCNVYTDTHEYTYENNVNSYRTMKLTYEGEHYYGAVPLIEYENGKERQGDFEQLIPAIDAYNTLMSDRVNDKEQFVDSFLFLKEIEVDTEDARKLKQERILMGYDATASAEYLSKIMNERDVKVLRDDFREDIYSLLRVPNMADDEFSSNTSGVAIRYKLLGFEQHAKNKETFFKKGLRRRFECYNNFFVMLNKMQLVPTHRVDFVFTRTMPVNNLEIAQMIQYLNNTVTQETLIDQLDFVTDAKEEAANARKEAAEKAEETAKSLEKGIYSKTPERNMGEDEE